MHLREIDNQVFVIQQVGRHETISTPGESYVEHRRLAAEAEAALASSTQAAAALEARIGEAILTGQPAGELRAEADALRETINSLRTDAANATIAANQVIVLLDRRDAELIRQGDAARLAALTAPYDQAIKEFSNVR